MTVGPAYPSPGAAELVAGDKNAMIRGGNIGTWWRTGPQSGEYSMLPVKSLSSTPCIYVVSNGRNLPPTNQPNNKVSTICGNPASLVTFNINVASMTLGWGYQKRIPIILH